MRGFAQSQAGSIESEHHSTMFWMMYTLDQLMNFGLAEDSWQLFATLTEGDHGDDPRPGQRDGVEET